MFGKRFLIGAQVVVVLLGLVGAGHAGDQNFPVGLWIVDAVSPNFPELGRDAGMLPPDLAQLRWHGIDIGNAGGVTINNWPDWYIPANLVSRNIQRKLARYDSLGVRIWLTPLRFHYSYPCSSGSYCTGKPRNYGYDVRGHDPFGGPGHEYFVSQGRGPCPGGGGWRAYQAPPTSGYFSPQTFFNDSLESVMGEVVDSVKSYHALWRYLYWDEFNGARVWTSKDDQGEFYWYQQRWMRYWENVWMDSTGATFTLPDNMSVGSWLKWKIEHRDTVHSVCENLGATGGPGGTSPWGDAVRTYTTLRFRGPGGDTTTLPNKPKSFTFDEWPYFYTSPTPTPIGDTMALHNWWTTFQDTAVAGSKAANPSDPVRVYMSQLQHIGTCVAKSNPPDYRITTPEEVRELVNLAVLHEIKGFFYFLYPSSPGGWANFVDENYVPFDAPYEDYVYTRSIGGYYPPNQLCPFYNFADSVHDPFRPLGQAPNPDSSQRGKEIYYLWKYAPYARNWNFMRTINDPIKIIAPHLPDLWRVGQRITSVVPSHGSVTKYPEYGTFADSFQGHNPTAFYAFIVNKDFDSLQRDYTVTVNGSKLPPPGGNRYYVLDLNSRHFVSSNGNIVFHRILKPGEGRLFRFILGAPPLGGEMEPLAATYVPNPYNGSLWSALLVTDPDISFRKTSEVAPKVQFTEGDTVVLSASVYNLGFANKTDSVKFYLGDPLAGGTFLGGSSVTVPGLSTSDTLPKTVTVTYNLVTNYTTPLGPYDINVILKGATSSAHSLLWLNSEDYATKVNNNPWDMTEDLLNPDISSYPGFTTLTDSISGVWEGETVAGQNPELHFRISSPIDASKYKMLQFRIYNDQYDSCTVRWFPYLPPDNLPPMTRYSAGWNLITINLGNYTWSGSKTDFYLKLGNLASTRKIRLAWAKLTTR